MNVTLPDGSPLELPEGATALDAALAIGPRLAKATVAARVNDKLVDTFHVLKDGDSVLWYYATFGSAGGPPTLYLKPLAGNCYSVTSYDDAGKASPAAGAVIQGRLVAPAAPPAAAEPGSA